MEEWRDVVGYEGLYQVSDKGAILSVGTRYSPRVLKQQTRKKDGYKTVCLWRDGKAQTWRVARVVAFAFHPNPEGLPDVDHIDGDRGRDHASNLRWRSKTLNGINRHTPFGITGAVGVFPAASKTNPYRAVLQVHGVNRHLGMFPDIASAAAARKAEYERHSK